MTDITNAEISRMLRNQAWERAKGELYSMLWTFKTPINASEGQFDEFNGKLETFIAAVEGESLHE